MSEEAQQKVVRIMHVGDIVGYEALNDVVEYLPKLKAEFPWDFLVINGENICDGKGLAEREAKKLFKAGAHVITTGNHIWENWYARPLLATDKRVLRPHNYPRQNPGSGMVVAESDNGVQVGVLQVQGRVYMQTIDCPFASAEKAVESLRSYTPVVVVDFHAEATAEKQALAWFLDGKVSVIAGTHTHVQTADARVFPGGTAFISDIGMSGPYNSVLGMETSIALKRFLLQTAHKYETAKGDFRLCAAYSTVDATTGKALSIRGITRPEW
jgi:metallophosphoesterase (TIGR00282 family)